MRIEWLGIVAIACGALSWVIGGGFPAYVLFISTLFGAGAAVVLTSMGYANIQPAHLLLAFLMVYAVVRQDQMIQIAHALRFPNEGFWLLLTTMYAVLSAIFFPNLFSASTYVYTIARTEIGTGIIAIPLGPSTSNITQTIYFLGDFVCFLIFYAFASSPEGLKALLGAALACASINLVFAGLDLGTYFTGTSELMSVIRNANYQMWDEAVVGGFKRIVGSFPEASTFASVTVGLFAFCIKLFLEGIYPRSTFMLWVLSLGALIFATSSAGYVGTLAFIALLYIGSVIQVVTRPVSMAMMIFVITGPVMVGALVAGVALHEPTWHVVEDLAATTIANKLSSDSGKERTHWNEQALHNFTDTFGLGAGVGSVRASSFPAAVLGSIGVFGALTYGAFLCCVFCRRKDRWPDRSSAAIQAAARAACLGQFLAACVAGGFIDLGLQFFIFAGLACAGPAYHSYARTP